MKSTYIVKERDTLTKIAGKHGVTVVELVAANSIKNPQFIKKDQVLIIPEKKQVLAPSTLPRAKVKDDLTKCLFIQAKCALGKPIPNLKVAIEVGSERSEHLTDAKGELPALSLEDKDKEVKIFVEKSSGGWKKISELTASDEGTSVTLQSPKTAVESKSAIHDGPAQTFNTDKPAPMAPGTTEEKRSSNGNPVKSISLECPNADNLRLQDNAKYRDIILAAGKRSGICPQAIAAIMNAEADTIKYEEQVPIINPKTKQQAVDKNGKLKFVKKKVFTTEWNTRSASTRSSARGMTQFVDGSWIGQATIPGTYLNVRAVSEGWITETTITVKHGKKTRTQKVMAFKLADGGLVTPIPKKTLAQTLNTGVYFSGRATAKDENLQKMMDLRYEPDFAIHTAVDYGMQNLAGLAEKGIKTSHLPDAEKAKLIYLTHHLGLDDAVAFIRRKMSASHAKELYITQVGPAEAADQAEKFDDDYLTAHRDWLGGFIDVKINLSQKMCNASSLVAPRSLITLTDSLA